MPVQPTAGSQFRNRARKALSEGKDFEARGEVNKVILQEVRAELGLEVSAGRKRIRDTASRAEARVEASIGKAEDRAMQAIETSKQKALSEITTAQCSTKAEPMESDDAHCDDTPEPMESEDTPM